MAKSATATAPAKKAAAEDLNIRPMEDKVVVRRDEAETKTESGLYLPETAKKKPTTGTVLAVGPGRVNTETGERIPMAIRKGDKVLFNTYSGTEVKLNGVDVLIIEEPEILAVVD